MLQLPSKNQPVILSLHIALALQGFPAVVIIQHKLYIASKIFHVYRSLREEERMGCKEKHLKWNQPRKRNVDPCPADDVVLTKAEYGKKKRSKVVHVNKWDCRPDTRRIVDPNKACTLRENLSEIFCKLYSADFAVCTATTETARKQAVEKKSMISSYGTSCFLQILDEEPTPEIS